MESQEIEIVVRGKLGPDLVAALDGFSVSSKASGRTRVVGVVLDQPRLLGILAMFDELHIDVISVNPVDAGSA
ncbi:hypothetical protein [Leifsonia sp. Leaf264]|uniref:hypothetical protein n=1 Tax=Leifsonia sp. Leaf264 TaxID=1736314 RepID=UPI0006FE49CD|nr:hypothetical protein [Leifsonia sp. Leaf264]KQP01489.1 hypothetical protein ASF30_02410 [Leifsonia sp. Leaf264]